MLHPLLKINVRRRVALPAAVVLATLAGSAPAMAIPALAPVGPTPTVQPAGAAPQGIIMRDGGVCDPIRHMGC